MDAPTKKYERLRVEYQLKDSQLKKKISENHKYTIEDYMSNWRMIGPLLSGIEPLDITDIDRNNYDESAKRRALLDLFQQRNGNGASYRELIKAMLLKRLVGDATNVFELVAGPPKLFYSDAVQPLGKHGDSLADSPGLAILISCDYINTTDTTLLGTNVDASEMLKTFKFLNYVVHQLRNDGEENCKAATTANVLELIKDVSEELKGHDERKTENKVIVFAFSGHGTTNRDDGKMKLKVNDGLLDLHEHIVLPLTSNEKVRKIPKLFFIDACRGNNPLKDKGVHEIELMAKDLDVDEDEGAAKGLVSKGRMTSKGNFRIDYSTIPYHLSYALDNPQDGSLWMPKMARALRGRNETVQTIAADVRGEVVDELKKMGGDTTQCGETQGRLIRSLKLVK